MAVTLTHMIGGVAVPGSLGRTAPVYRPATGEHSDAVGGGIDNWNLRQALGVVAGITPFNFPVMVPMWMVPIALACGNTFVLKPSERDPSPALLLAELLAEAGLPAGAFNVVHGDKVAVDALITNLDVAAVSFVGSTPIAEAIHAEASRRGRPVLHPLQEHHAALARQPRQGPGVHDASREVATAATGQRELIVCQAWDTS
jgi:hypothetical protein